MKRMKFTSFMGTSILASSLLLPITTTTFAQTAPSAPETTQMETRDNDDNTGLWGLLGLTGLLGLAGLRRRPEHVRTSADPRERNRV
jgi:MYXO-CTERM domain-containing protein